MTFNFSDLNQKIKINLKDHWIDLDQAKDQDQSDDLDLLDQRSWSFYKSARSTRSFFYKGWPIRDDFWD